MPMSIVKPLIKPLVFFFIFATGYCDKHRHNTIPLFNKNICKKDNTYASIASTYVPLNKRIVYYTCRHSGTQRVYNPYTDILRKYIYIVNVVVIYIILYSL